MRNNKLTMITKLNAIKEWKRANNLTAKKFKVHPYQIPPRVINKDKIKNLVEKSSLKLTLHKGKNQNI